MGAAKAVEAPPGYEELDGKCSGSWIENWANGHYAHYGEDNMNSVDDCADVCNAHAECAGFYVKEGRCSHWRSGNIVPTPRAGHTCYRKGSSATLASFPITTVGLVVQWPATQPHLESVQVTGLRCGRMEIMRTMEKIIISLQCQTVLTPAR